MTSTPAQPQPASVPVPVPDAGSEVEHLLGALDRQRATLRWKVADLDAAGLVVTVGSSSMTLGGLLKHLAFVEDLYFTARLLGTSPGAPWEYVDWEDDPDWEWSSAADDTPDQLYALHTAAVHRSRRHLADALAAGGLDQRLDLGWPEGRRPSLRRMVCDLIEEYARHTGHADLIREAVDGRVGEDPPADFVV